MIGLFIVQGRRQFTIGLAFSALLCVAVLFVVLRGFSIDAWVLAAIGAGVVLVVATTVLLSIYVSVRGVIRREPSAALRQA